tara:strand:- start:66 stop:860 length:795 start_codon:yes stop_codon:yes gene_type:complete
MAQQMNTIMLLLIFISLIGILLVVFFMLDRVNDIYSGKNKVIKINPDDSFSGLFGKNLWDAMSGIPMTGLDPKTVALLKPRYELVLQKHIEILFEEGKSDGREGFSMPVKNERLIQTIRGEIESWMPHKLAVGIYRIGYNLITEPDEDLETFREELDKIGDDLFSATGIPPHPISKILMPTTKYELEAEEEHDQEEGDKKINALPSVQDNTDSEKNVVVNENAENDNEEFLNESDTASDLEENSEESLTQEASFNKESEKVEVN